MTPACQSVALWGVGSEKDQGPLPTFLFLSWIKLSLSSHLDAGNFSFSLYPLVPLKLLPSAVVHKE